MFILLFIFGYKIAELGLTVLIIILSFIGFAWRIDRARKKDFKEAMLEKANATAVIELKKEVNKKMDAEKAKGQYEYLHIEIASLKEMYKQQYEFISDKIEEIQSLQEESRSDIKTLIKGLNK